MGMLASLAGLDGVAKLASSLFQPRTQRPVIQVMPATGGNPFADRLGEALNSRKAAETAADKLIKSHDANDDGILSQAELGLDANAFGKLDLDRDGSVTRAELIQAKLKRS